eukprot:TRINITY_DN7811_c0_g1_i1.p1 TRINITY_DN7811_c0_g1~~TRINITY_DN7811_c0_g1_i1.p1  ORF type:complete len:1759 (+),score=268.64 TRINITY_DN7811_c0_g1_i1:189-5465(+)
MKLDGTKRSEQENEDGAEEGDGKAANNNEEIYWGDELKDFLDGRDINPFGARPRVQLEIMRGRALKYWWLFAMFVLIIHIVLSAQGPGLRWECVDSCGRGCDIDQGTLSPEEETSYSNRTLFECDWTSQPDGTTWKWTSNINLNKYNYDVLFVVTLVSNMPNNTNPAMHYEDFSTTTSLGFDGETVLFTNPYHLDCSENDGCDWKLVHGDPIGNREGTWEYNISITASPQFTLPPNYEFRLVILKWKENYTKGEAALRYVMLAWVLYLLPYFLWKNFGRPSMIQDWLPEHVWGTAVLVFLLCYLNPMFLPGLAYRDETGARGQAFMAFEVLLSWVYFIVLWGVVLIVPLSVAFGKTRWLWIGFGNGRGGMFLPSIILGLICAFFLGIAIRDFIYADGQRYLQDDSSVPRSMASNTLIRHHDNYALTLAETILFYMAITVLVVTVVYCRFRLQELAYTSARLSFLSYRIYLLIAVPFVLVSAIIRIVEYVTASPLHSVTSTGPDSVRDIVLFSVMSLLFGHFFVPIYSGYISAPPPPHSQAWLYWKWSSDWYAWWTHYGKSLYFFITEKEGQSFEEARVQRLSEELQDKTERLFEKNQRHEPVYHPSEPSPNLDENSSHSDSVASAANQKYKMLLEKGLRLQLPEPSPRRSLVGDYCDTARGAHDSMYLSARGGGLPMQNASVSASFRHLKKLNLSLVKSPPDQLLNHNDPVFDDILQTESVCSQSPRGEEMSPGKHAPPYPEGPLSDTPRTFKSPASNVLSQSTHELKSTITDGVKSPTSEGIKSPVTPGLRARAERRKSPTSPSLKSPIKHTGFKLPKGLKSPTSPALDLPKLKSPLRSPTSDGFRSPKTDGMSTPKIDVPLSPQVDENDRSFLSDSGMKETGLFKVIQPRSPLQSSLDDTRHEEHNAPSRSSSFHFLGNLSGIEVPRFEDEEAQEREKAVLPPAEGPYKNFFRRAMEARRRSSIEETEDKEPSAHNDPFDATPMRRNSSWNSKNDKDKDQSFLMPIFCLESAIECFNASWMSYMLDCEEDTPYSNGEHLPQEEDTGITWYGDYSRVPTEYRDDGGGTDEQMAMNHKRCDYFIHGVQEGQAKLHQEISWIDSWMPGGVHRDLLYSPEGDLVAWREGAEEWEGEWRMLYHSAVAWLRAGKILDTAVESQNKWKSLLLMLKKALLSTVDASLLILDGWHEEEVLTEEEYEERRAFLRGQVWVMCNLPQETLIQIPETTPTVCKTTTTFPVADLVVVGCLVVLAESSFASRSWKLFAEEMLVAIERNLCDTQVYNTPYTRSFQRSFVASAAVEWGAKHFRCTTGEVVHALDIMRQEGLIIPCIPGSRLRVSCDGSLWKIPPNFEPEWKEDSTPWGERRIRDMLLFSAKESMFPAFPPERDPKPNYRAGTEFIHAEYYGYKLEAVISDKRFGLKAILLSSPLRVILAFRGTDNDANVDLDLDVCPGPFEAHNGWELFYENMKQGVGRLKHSFCGCGGWKKRASNKCHGPGGCCSKFSTCHQLLYGSEPQCHVGFINAWQALESSVYKVISAICPVDDQRQVFVTGHSLGGALAQMAAYHLTWKFYKMSKKVKVYAFASPRVGNVAFATAYNTCVPDTFRVNMNGDPVTNVPPSFGRARYYHAGTEIHLGRWESEASWCIDPTWLDSGAIPMPRPLSHTLAEINRGLNKILDHFKWDWATRNGGLLPAGEDVPPEEDEEHVEPTKEPTTEENPASTTESKDKTYLWPWVRISQPDVPELDIGRYESPSELLV